MVVNEGNECKYDLFLSRFPMAIVYTWTYIITANILDEVEIDFEPLYRCIHVYNTLGTQNEFKNSYEEDRRVRIIIVTMLHMSKHHLNHFP